MASPHTVKLALEVEDVISLERRSRRETWSRPLPEGVLKGSFYWCLMDDGYAKEVKTVAEVRALAESLRKAGAR